MLLVSLEWNFDLAKLCLLGLGRIGGISKTVAIMLLAVLVVVVEELILNFLLNCANIHYQKKWFLLLAISLSQSDI